VRRCEERKCLGGWEALNLHTTFAKIFHFSFFFFPFSPVMSWSKTEMCQSLAQSLFRNVVDVPHDAPFRNLLVIHFCLTQSLHLMCTT